MKKATREARERIEAVACANIGCAPRRLWIRPNDLRRAVDGLDEAEATEKKLRAENRDLKARLKLVKSRSGFNASLPERAALDLKNKRWRNPKHPKGGKR